jgi:hypothetical protein
VVEISPAIDARFLPVRGPLGDPGLEHVIISQRVVKELHTQEPFVAAVKRVPAPHLVVCKSLARPIVYHGIGDEQRHARLLEAEMRFPKLAALLLDGPHRQIHIALGQVTQDSDVMLLLGCHQCQDTFWTAISHRPVACSTFSL